MRQCQFRITDPAVNIPPMAFNNDEERQATLAYALDQAGVEPDDLALIVFTRIEDDGTHVIEKALQRGEDVTKYARFA